MTARRVRTSFAALAAGLIFAGSAAAAPGDLDPTFGTGGVVATAFGPAWSYAFGVAIQDDGRIVAAGGGVVGTAYRFALSRHLPDGSLDPGFGTGGRVTTSFSAGGSSLGQAVALQRDGKILVGGTANRAGQPENFALARYLRDGRPDATFGSGGRVTTSIGSGNDVVYALALQADGRILAAGSRKNGGADGFALARYRPNGTLDPTFGTGGKVTTTLSPAYALFRAVAVQRDGKILAAGSTTMSGGFQAVVMRYTATGHLDPGFGTAGVVVVPEAVLGGSEARALRIQPDGKILVGGWAGWSGSRFLVLRLDGAGVPDPSFGTGGAATIAVSTFYAEVEALALQTDGRIVVAGRSSSATSYEFGLARLEADGTPDTSFGTGGTVVTATGADLNEDAYGLALQADGRIVASGMAEANSTGNAILLRYEAGPWRYRSDARFGLLGDDVYDATGAGQTTAVKIAAGKTATLTVTLENDGTETDDIAVKGAGSRGAFTARYFDGATDVTAQVVAGTWKTTPLAPGSSADLSVVVRPKPGTPSGTGAAFAVTATSGGSAGSIDTVKVKAAVK
jgi:uncharacterized delta-60 repeat protein